MSKQTPNKSVWVYIYPEKYLNIWPHTFHPFCKEVQSCVIYNLPAFANQSLHCTRADSEFTSIHLWKLLQKALNLAEINKYYIITLAQMENGEPWLFKTSYCCHHSSSWILSNFQSIHVERSLWTSSTLPNCAHPHQWSPPPREPPGQVSHPRNTMKGLCHQASPCPPHCHHVTLTMTSDPA